MSNFKISLDPNFWGDMSPQEIETAAATLASAASEQFPFTTFIVTPENIPQFDVDNEVHSWINDNWIDFC